VARQRVPATPPPGRGSPRQHGSRMSTITQDCRAMLDDAAKRHRHAMMPGAATLPAALKFKVSQYAPPARIRLDPAARQHQPAAPCATAPQRCRAAP
jgi:hypothetical protein